jgi:hypothetical protein
VTNETKEKKGKRKNTREMGQPAEKVAVINPVPPE